MESVVSGTVALGWKFRRASGPKGGEWELQDKPRNLNQGRVDLGN